MALSVRVPRTRSVAAAPRGRIAGPGFLGLTGDGISGRGRSRDYVLGAALAPIETEFCLFAAPCGQRRQIVYGNRGFRLIVQDSDPYHPGHSFQRLSVAMVFSWPQFGGFGLVVGSPLWGPGLVLVA